LRLNIGHYYNGIAKRGGGRRGRGRSRKNNSKTTVTGGIGSGIMREKGGASGEERNRKKATRRQRVRGRVNGCWGIGTNIKCGTVWPQPDTERSVGEGGTAEENEIELSRK